MRHTHIKKKLRTESWNIPEKNEQNLTVNNVNQNENERAKKKDKILLTLVETSQRYEIYKIQQRIR